MLESLSPSNLGPHVVFEILELGYINIYVYIYIYISSAHRRLSSVVIRYPSVARRPSSVVRRPSSLVRRPSSVVHSLFVFGCFLFDVSEK